MVLTHSKVAEFFNQCKINDVRKGDMWGKAYEVSISIYMICTSSDFCQDSVISRLGLTVTVRDF